MSFSLYRYWVHISECIFLLFYLNEVYLSGWYIVEIHTCKNKEKNYIQMFSFWEVYQIWKYPIQQFCPSTEIMYCSSSNCRWVSNAEQNPAGEPWHTPVALFIVGPLCVWGWLADVCLIPVIYVYSIASCLCAEYLSTLRLQQNGWLLQTTFKCFLV